jgi:hypothetical protein
VDQGLVVPGLLQTPEYAEIVIRSVALPGTSESKIKRQVEARIARQEILKRETPPMMSFVLDESVCRRWVGLRRWDAAVLQSQLEHLAELSRRPNLDIQMLPFSYGPYFGLNGPFVILEFSDPDANDVLYLEAGRPSQLIQNKPEQVAAYRRMFGEFSESASDPAEFDQMIERIIAGLNR